MRTATIKELKARLPVSGSGVFDALVHAQVGAMTPKATRDGKPYLEVQFVDSSDQFTLRVWSDAPAFGQCQALGIGESVELAGEFSLHHNYGVEARRWSWRSLDPEEAAALLAGSEDRRAQQMADYEYIRLTIESLADPRLRLLGGAFLELHGARLRRTAAARTNHHARRGGLVEHTAQMMRAASALATVYPRLHRDLMLAGVLFHDAGKLWENHVGEQGFQIEQSERGEMLGHIVMGIELINSLWRQLKADGAFGPWADAQPNAERLRLHLLHLVASHHAEMAFGSPVVPKTPEAWALHYLDNIDAKMEMIFNVYASAQPVAPNIFDRVWPLPGPVISPLALFPVEPASEPAGELGLDAQPEAVAEEIFAGKGAANGPDTIPSAAMSQASPAALNFISESVKHSDWLQTIERGSTDAIVQLANGHGFECDIEDLRQAAREIIDGRNRKDGQAQPTKSQIDKAAGAMTDLQGEAGYSGDTGYSALYGVAGMILKL